MAKKSAGLLMYRFRRSQLEIFLVHLGGPFWRKKDLGTWSMPKGEYSDEENSLDAAKREFFEETGFKAEGDFKELGMLRQPNGKWITAWAFEGHYNPKTVRSNLFSMEWPPCSGKLAEFPEVDRGEWLSLDSAKRKIIRGQIGFLDKLSTILG